MLFIYQTIFILLIDPIVSYFRAHDSALLGFERKCCHSISIFTVVEGFIPRTYAMIVMLYFVMLSLIYV